MSVSHDSAASATPPTGLFGRAQEWQYLQELRTQTAAGHGHSVLLEGETGIGKTVLLRAFADDCEKAGFLVLRGSGSVFGQSIPFQLVRSCFEMLSPQVRDERAEDLAELFLMLDGQSTFGSADWEFGVTEALGSLLDRWCAQGPVALMLDDVHRTDDSSLVGLSRLHRSLRQLPLLICASAHPTRSDQDGGGVLRALRDRWIHDLSLGPLDHTSVACMVRGLLGADPGPQLQEYLVGAAGNPLFVSELISGLVHTGSVNIREGFAEISWPGRPPPALPPSLRAAVLGRFTDLSAGTKEFLAAMAVMGPRVRLRDVSIVLGVPALRLWKAVEEVVDLGLLEEAGQYLCFRHALDEQVILENLPLSLRRTLEVQVSRQMVQSGAPEQIAEFLSRASISPDSEMISHLVGIAPAMVLRAPSAAAEVLRQALAESDARHPGRAVLHRNLVSALLRSEDFAAAMGAARAALADLADSDEERELRRLLVQSLIRQGRFAEAVLEADAALGTMPADAPGRARLHAMIAFCCLRSTDADRTAAEASAAVRAGEAAGDPYVVAFALGVLALEAVRDMRPAEGLALADDAQAMLGSQEIDPDLPQVPYFIKGLVLTETDRVEEAHRAFDSGLRNCNRGGNYYLTWYHLGKARLYFHEGRWDDALAEIGVGLETVDHFDIFDVLRSQAAVIAVHRGEQQDLAGLAERARATGEDTVGFMSFWECALALAHEANGEAHAALDALADARERYEGAARRRFMHRAAPDLLRLATITGDAARVRSLCAELAGLAADGAYPHFASVLKYGRGLAAQDPTALEDSAVSFQTQGWVLYEGYAWEAASEARALLGQMPAARAALQSALALYERTGAVQDAGRAEKRLKTVGVRLRQRARPAQQTGWHALTATEREIARHVAEGRSNPEIGARLFLSPRTVQFHLSAIFTKLDITSRVELAVSFRGQEQAAPGAAT
ncbi:ATP-binding protein [Streptomyces sp. NPDC050523]|uniref:ATP-binding protein n=1 Tax=Streptomyces sp. NPDC050523 TaxID=3365622 RepID=UPI0037B56137